MKPPVVDYSELYRMTKVITKIGKKRIPKGKFMVFIDDKHPNDLSLMVFKGSDFVHFALELDEVSSEDIAEAFDLVIDYFKDKSIKDKIIKP